MKHTALPTLSLSLVGLALFAACNSMESPTDTDTSPVKSSAGTDSKATAAAEKVFPYDVKRATLDNGLRVIMVPMQSDGLVSYWSVVRTGSRDEVEEGVTGFAHFFEHMMFRGTEKLPGKAYDRIVNGMGADANAFTSDDMTAYHLSFAREGLPKVIEIEADRFQNLAYTEGQFKTESGAVYGEYRKGRSSPFEVLDEAVREVAFDEHTYKHTTIGFEADIKAMPEKFAYSRTFFERFYRPENVVILVTGDFDTDATLKKIEKEYGGWKRGYVEPAVTPEPKQTAQRKIDIPFEGQTLPIVAMAFKGPAFVPTDRTAMAARLVGELAFGSTSPLYKQLVLDEQKVQTMGGNVDANRDPGLWWVYAMVKEPADVPAVQAALWKAIDDLRRTPVARERLDAVRSHERYGFLTGLATPDGVASSLARFVALTGDVKAVDTMFSTLATVTPEDVRKAADRWLRPENCTVAILHTKGQEIPAMSAVPAASKAVAASAASMWLGVSDGVVAKSTGAALMHVSVSSNAPTIAGAFVCTDGSGRENLRERVEALSAVGQKGQVSQEPVLLPVAQDPTVAFRIWFQAGSQDDPPGKEGLAALTGALISEGATKVNAYDKILAKLFPMAAWYDVSVDREMTFVNGQVHKDHADAYYRLLVEAITIPAFAQADFERNRDQMVSGIENGLRYVSGEELAKATLYERVFAGTPYAHPPTGTVASLKSLTVDDVKAFHAKFYTRDNVVIGLGGAYARDLPERMKSDLGALPAGTPEHPAKPTPAPIDGRHLVLVDNESAIGSSISMGAPISVKRGEKDFYALWIANSWLGEHRNSSSHLYQVIREERGLNYGDYAYIEAFPNGGRRTMPPQGVGRRQQLFEVWVRTVPTENTWFATRAALRAVETLVENGMTKEQFDFTRAFLKGYSAHFAESTFDRLGYALDDQFYGVEGHLPKFRKMMDEITLADVNAAVKKYMRTDDMVIAIVTSDAEGLKAAIESGDATPVVYPEGIVKPDAILSEDKVIETWPLKLDAADVTVHPVDTMFAGPPARPARH